MDTKPLAALVPTGDPFRFDGPGLAAAAAAGFDGIGDDQIRRAQDVLALLDRTRPPAPPADGRAIIASVADAILAAATAGAEPDVDGLIAAELAAHDAAHVRSAAHRVATTRAKAALAGVVRSLAPQAFAHFTERIRQIGREYEKALDGRPFPDVEAALREGGAAKKRLDTLERCRQQADHYKACWVALRGLVLGRVDETARDIASRFDRRPPGMTWDKVRRDTRSTPMGVLDIAVKYGLVDALVLDSKDAADERAKRWRDEDRQRPRQSMAGVRRINAPDDVLLSR